MLDFKEENYIFAGHNKKKINIWIRDDNLILKRRGGGR